MDASWLSSPPVAFLIVLAVAIILCVYRHTESLDVAHLRELKG